MAKSLSQFLSRIWRGSFHSKVWWGYEHQKGVYQNVATNSETSLTKLSWKFGHASIWPVKAHWTMNISATSAYIAKSFRWLQHNFLRSSLNSTCLISSEQYSHMYIWLRQLKVRPGEGNQFFFYRDSSRARVASDRFDLKFMRKLSKSYFTSMPRTFL